MKKILLTLLLHQNKCSFNTAIINKGFGIEIEDYSIKELEKQYGTIHQTWSPLVCRRNNIFNNEILNKIAQKHYKSTAQVALRFLYQQGIIINAQTKND